ncbi:MAG TPA: glyoxalase superfamily protein [Rhodanobacter sp.]|jgi:hypothetical protein|nr:glyoxalase superfamily protein [Rhodanobacter sp.]
MSIAYKARARHLAAYLADKYQIKLSHTQCLEAIAAEEGVRSWQVLAARNDGAADLFGGSLDPESLVESAHRILAAAVAIHASHVHLIYEPGQRNYRARFRARGMIHTDRSNLNPEWVRSLIETIARMSHPMADEPSILDLDQSVCETLGVYKGEVVNSPVIDGGQFMTVALLYTEADRYKVEMAAAMREGELKGRRDMMELNGGLWRHLGELQVWGGSKLLPYISELTQIALTEDDEHKACTLAFEVVKFGPNPVAEVASVWRTSESESIQALGNALLEKLSVKP